MDFGLKRGIQFHYFIHVWCFISFSTPVNLGAPVNKWPHSSPWRRNSSANCLFGSSLGTSTGSLSKQMKFGIDRIPETHSKFKLTCGKIDQFLIPTLNVMAWLVLVKPFRPKIWAGENLRISSYSDPLWPPPIFRHGRQCRWEAPKQSLWWLGVLHLIRPKRFFCKERLKLTFWLVLWLSLMGDTKKECTAILDPVSVCNLQEDHMVISPTDFDGLFHLFIVLWSKLLRKSFWPSMELSIWGPEAALPKCADGCSRCWHGLYWWYKERKTWWWNHWGFKRQVRHFLGISPFQAGENQRAWRKVKETWCREILVWCITYTTQSHTVLSPSGVDSKSLEFQRQVLCCFSQEGLLVVWRYDL